ncbi:cytosolic phospholipase A2 gamma-like [Aquarana catesbeiana]|uniref:cytosolic phospholipase A2 gamma-like n=1 Tax=Aquarana catesbeiana TaxID=8400 RepID=UPI003CCA3431
MAPKKGNIDLVDGSEEETIAVKARMKKVKETLLSLGMNVKENCNPPVIAVLGSGGGLRAMVGFLGTISKLAELNLLGTVTFISAISGATWCMSSLYAKSNWSDFSYMKDLEFWLCERIKLETDRDWTKPWEKIKEKFLGDSYTLTDLWAYTFVFFVMNKINEEKLSSHKEICDIGEDPYPIYCAIIKTDCFTEMYKKVINSDWRCSQKQAQTSVNCCSPVPKEGKGVPEISWSEFIRVKDRCVRIFKRTCSWVTTGVKKVIPKKSWFDVIGGVYDNAKVMKNIVFCFAAWEWGTTNNFLYKCEHKIPKNSDLLNKERIHLVDAGLEINTPYPLVLPPHRKVDLILSFDFSLGDPFETLKRTAEYCEDHRIPFPVNTKERYEYPPTKSCYVFEGDGYETPDVMHFPLFNTQTCEEALNLYRLSKKYAARVPSYDTSMMNELLDIAKKNVESNMGEIQVKIQQCVWRSNKREMS